ncbi:MAG: TonB-dependent receptor plug domain-containing protein [Opitutaceae bacterium]
MTSKIIPSIARRRMPVVCAILVAASVVSAQTATAPVPRVAPTAPADDDRIVMSAFEVGTTQGRGYTSTNSATGFKTNESLLKIPQAVTLVTRDLIDDIGAVDSSNILQFAGVSNFFAGESFAMRGTRIGYPLLDEMPDGVPYLDNVNLDSYTVLRGPASTLYLNASLGGTVLTTSKRPLAKPQYAFKARFDQHGAYRGEADLTGPIGSLGEVKFSYRFVSAVQGGESYFKNMVDHRRVYHPSLQMAYKNTVVRYAFDYQQLDHPPAGNSFIKPDGSLYTGAGRDEGYYAVGMMENFHRRGHRLIVIQKISENWDVKVAATRWWFSRLAGIVFNAGGLNWPAQTLTLTARRNDQKLDFSVAQFDVNGKYHLGPMATQTTFGASYSDEESQSKFWASPTFGSVTVPIANPRMDLIRAPRASDYTVPANPGSRATTYRGNAYAQQTIDVIPERLTLVAGLTRSKIKINNITNLATLPPATVTKGEANLHRYGVVFNVTKEAVLYAMESTTFAPTNARDINLNFLPSAVGKGREVGFKTALLDGRLSSTFSVYKLELTNQSFFAGIRPDGVSYFAPIGSTTQKGFDFDLAYTPLPNLQFIGTYYHGKVNDQTGAKVANSYDQQISLVGRYEFADRALKGLNVGAGFVRISGRMVARGAYNINGAAVQPALLGLKPGNLVNLFASYKIGRHWLLRSNLDNVLDEAYALGAQNAYFIDPSPPRTLSVSATYRF